VGQWFTAGEAEAARFVGGQQRRDALPQGIG
jgi:hypothetical protein